MNVKKGTLSPTRFEYFLLASGFDRTNLEDCMEALTGTRVNRDGSRPNRNLAIARSCQYCLEVLKSVTKDWWTSNYLMCLGTYNSNQKLTCLPT